MSRPARPGSARRVVIGVGNPYRSDDGAGPEVARRVRDGAPAGVDVFEHDGEPSGLIDLWEDADLAIVVDAIRGPAGDHGPVVRVEVDSGWGDLSSLSAVSSHGVGPGDAVELAAVLGRLPRRLMLYGIEGTSFAPGLGLSPEVEASIGAVIESILEDLSQVWS